MDDEHPGGGAIGQRLLGDQFGRQCIIELRQIHSLHCNHGKCESGAEKFFVCSSPAAGRQIFEAAGVTRAHARLLLETVESLSDWWIMRQVESILTLGQQERGWLIASR
jgi:hypothetical protein